jgi:hypothetical protein
VAAGAAHCVPVALEKKTDPHPPPGVPVKANRYLALDGVGDNFLKNPDAQDASKIL